MHISYGTAVRNVSCRQGWWDWCGTVVGEALEEADFVLTGDAGRVTVQVFVVVPGRGLTKAYWRKEVLARRPEERVDIRRGALGCCIRL
jgi:hypothetical protein